MDVVFSSLVAPLNPNSSEDLDQDLDLDLDLEPTVHMAVRCALASAYLLLMGAGLTGNAALLKILVGGGAGGGASNIFIGSLAAGDLLLLLTCPPVDAFRFLSEDWILGETACKLLPLIQLTSVGVSVFTLTALSADRYRVIVNPMDLQTSALWTASWTAFIWLLSVLLAVPEAVFSQVVSIQGHRNDTSDTLRNCVPYPLSNQIHPRIHSVVVFLVYFLFPLAIIAHYYYHIARALIRSANNIPGEISQQSKTQMETRKHLAKMVLVLVVLFALCWFPNHVLYLYRSFRYQNLDVSMTHLVLTMLARFLSFSSSCVNPLVLYLLSQSFRRQFRTQLPCGRRLRPQHQASYVRSTFHIRLASIKTTTPTVAVIAAAANDNVIREEEVAL